jgi:hypothetical protein
MSRSRGSPLKRRRVKDRLQLRKDVAMDHAIPTRRLRQVNLQMAGLPAHL